MYLRVAVVWGIFCGALLCSNEQRDGHNTCHPEHGEGSPHRFYRQAIITAEMLRQSLSMTLLWCLAVTSSPVIGTEVTSTPLIGAAVTSSPVIGAEVTSTPLISQTLRVCQLPPRGKPKRYIIYLKIKYKCERTIHNEEIY